MKFKVVGLLGGADPMARIREGVKVELKRNGGGNLNGGMAGAANGMTVAILLLETTTKTPLEVTTTITAIITLSSRPHPQQGEAIFSAEAEPGAL